MSTLHFLLFKLHPNTLHSTSLHLSTLHFLSFKLHPTTLQYPLIWLNPISISYRSISCITVSRSALLERWSDQEVFGYLKTSLPWLTQFKNVVYKVVILRSHHFSSLWLAITRVPDKFTAVCISTRVMSVFIMQKYAWHLEAR